MKTMMKTAMATEINRSRIHTRKPGRGETTACEAPDPTPDEAPAQCSKVCDGPGESGMVFLLYTELCIRNLCIRTRMGAESCLALLGSRSRVAGPGLRRNFQPYSAAGYNCENGEFTGNLWTE